MTKKQALVLLHQVKLLQDLIGSIKLTGYEVFPSEIDELEELVGSIALADNFPNFYDGPVEFFDNLHAVDHEKVEILPCTTFKEAEGCELSIPSIVTFEDSCENRWWCIKDNSTLQNYSNYDDVFEKPRGTVKVVEVITIIIKQLLEEMSNNSHAL